MQIYQISSQYCIKSKTINITGYNTLSKKEGRTSAQGFINAVTSGLNFLIKQVAVSI